jgi:carbonic anhydrase
MTHAKPVPSFLAQRYHDWKGSTYADKRSLHHRLADEGQSPRGMIITCCDSRVQASSIFGADPGDFFIHRNIANLVPPYSEQADGNGTSAAVEYGVTALKVPHLIVMGHSQCGGVAGCLQMCEGKAPALEEGSSFVGRWIDILRPGYERVSDLPEEQRGQALEHEAVLLSIENLMSYPFVRSRVEEGSLSLHGLWVDIREGDLLGYAPEDKAFKPL